MNQMDYLLSHFFTHKDYLLPPRQIPGTIFTPLHYGFAVLLLGIIFLGGLWVIRHPEKIRPVLMAVWLTMVIWEPIIVLWDSMAGPVKAFDLQTSLSLYPCSIYLYAMPFLFWGRGILKKMAGGYLCTLGLLGASINFLYPATRLVSYSCISFPGLHTFCFHGAMLFTCVVLLGSGLHRYQARNLRDLLAPSVFSLILSVPANLVNYSPIDADYMFFKGRIYPLNAIFAGAKPETVTLVLYLLYVAVPALFYIPSYLRSRSRVRQAEDAREAYLAKFI